MLTQYQMSQFILHVLGSSVKLQKPIPRNYEIGMGEVVFKNTFFNIQKKARVIFKCYKINLNGRQTLIGARWYNVTPAYYRSFEILKQVFFYLINADVNNPILQKYYKLLISRMVVQNNQLIFLPATVDNGDIIYSMSVTKDLELFLGLGKSKTYIYPQGGTALLPIMIGSKTLFDITCDQIARSAIGGNSLRSVAINSMYNDTVCVEFDNIEWKALHEGSLSFLSFNLQTVVHILYFTIFLRPQTA